MASSAAFPGSTAVSSLGLANGRVVQYDRITHLDPAPAPRIKATDRTPVSTFDFHSGHEGSPAFVRLCGKHLVLPIDAKPADLAYPSTSAESYPEFTVGTDPGTGQPITFTCDPDRLSNQAAARTGGLGAAGVSHAIPPEACSGPRRSWSRCSAVRRSL